MAAHVALLSRGGLHQLEIMIRPEHRAALPEVIDDALAALPGRSADRIYCAVRSYQSEIASALETCGFAPLLDQDVLLRYTTANVRLPAGETVPFHVEVRDKLPQRVPTFLRGRPRDEWPR